MRTHFELIYVSQIFTFETICLIYKLGNHKRFILSQNDPFTSSEENICLNMRKICAQKNYYNSQIKHEMIYSQLR